MTSTRPYYQGKYLKMQKSQTKNRIYCYSVMFTSPLQIILYFYSILDIRHCIEKMFNIFLKLQQPDLTLQKDELVSVDVLLPTNINLHPLQNSKFFNNCHDIVQKFSRDTTRRQGTKFYL